MAFVGRRSEAKTRIAHAIAGLTIAIEGYERWESGFAAVGGMMVLLGLLLILYSRFHPKLHHSNYSRYAETGVFLIEAAVLALIATVFFIHGKKMLPWLYVGLVIVYLTIAIVRHLSSRVHPVPNS